MTDNLPALTFWGKVRAIATLVVWTIWHLRITWMVAAAALLYRNSSLAVSIVLMILVVLTAYGDGSDAEEKMKKFYERIERRREINFRKKMKKLQQ